MNRIPRRSPIHNGTSENEKKPSVASTNILFNEYFGLPASRGLGLYGNMTLGNPIQTTMPLKNR